MSESLWTARELAKFLNYQESTIRRLTSQHPDRLPPRVNGMGRPRWNPETVRSWAATPMKTEIKAGRPRISRVF